MSTVTLATGFCTQHASVEEADKFVEELKAFIAARQGIEPDAVVFDELEYC